MKNKLIVLLALVMIIALSLTVFTACNKDAKNDGSSSENNTENVGGTDNGESDNQTDVDNENNNNNEPDEDDDTVETISYTLTFNDENGDLVEEVEYTIETSSITEPSVPEKTGYTGVWGAYTLDETNQTVEPIYTIIEYTITFNDENGDLVEEVEYTIETSSITEPIVPEKTGYTGVWGAYTLDETNQTVEPIYTIIEYTITFNDENGDLVEEVEYTIETSSITEPIVPEKTGYTGVWGAYTLDETNQTVEPVYTAIEYTITFNSNGAGDVASITKAGGESITLPTLSKYGYEFFGWFDASNAEFDSTTMPYQNKSLVAKWSDSYAGLEFVLINDSTEYKVTGIGSALDGGKTELLIPSVYNGIPVTSIGEAAFVPNFELETVKFEDNSNLTEIENWAFSSCFELKSVEFGANSKLDSIGDNAFADCSNLTEISIPDSVTSIGDSVFSCCESLTQIKVGADNQNYQSIDGNLYSKDGKTLIQYCAGKTATSFEIPSGVTMIGAGAFSTCTDLLDISIPDSVTMIGEDAFEDCTGLTGIVISDAVENIGDSAFAGCTGLLSIAIPDSVKTIGEDAFNGCESLTSVTFGASSQLTEIKDWTFAYCGDLTNIVIPDSISKIGERAFYKCNSLTINAEATEKPSGWHENWNSSNCPVIWGYRI